jgi:hypothetical protein
MGKGFQSLPSVIEKSSLSKLLEKAESHSGALDIIRKALAELPHPIEAEDITSCEVKQKYIELSSPSASKATIIQYATQGLLEQLKTQHPDIFTPNIKTVKIKISLE